MAANPFKPTAGKMPPVLIGRQNVLDDFAEGLDNGAGAPGRLMLITGQRGFGKTVVLSEFRRIALAHGWDVFAETAAPGMCNRLIASLSSTGLKLKSLQIAPSIGFSGIASANLGSATLATPELGAVTLREAINARLKKLDRGKGILFTIDEVQAISMPELVALATTFQHVLADQDMEGVPDVEKRGIAIAFAGIPSLMDDLLNNKVLTFLRRSMKHALGEVLLIDARDGYIDAVEKAGKAIAPDVALAAARAAEGHPYMVQLVGYYMWRSADRRGSAVIEQRDVEAGCSDALLAFYEAVCAPVYYGLRSPQRLFIEQMAVDESGATRVSDIAKRAARTDSWAHKYRTSLIREQIIEPVGYGLVRFCVPHLGDYIRNEILWHG